VFAWLLEPESHRAYESERPKSRQQAREWRTAVLSRNANGVDGNDSDHAHSRPCSMLAQFHSRSRLTRERLTNHRLTTRSAIAPGINAHIPMNRATTAVVHSQASK
jgi:hypothetical protein